MYKVRNRIEQGYALKKGYTGKGIGIAIFDTGIFLHPDLKERIVEMNDYIGNKAYPYDDNGHGTHVAGIIAGDGKLSNGKYAGIAPKALLYSYKILNENGNGNLKGAIEALEECILMAKEKRIRIINFSMGMGKNVDREEKELLLNCLEKAWDNNIVVVCAAGNEGPMQGSITPPGNLRKIITVGAMDDEDESLVENLNHGYSSRGPTRSCIVKPEVVAPGTNIMSCNNTERPAYTLKSGTSMSTPVVSGAIALLLEKYPGMTPAQVKLRLYHTCEDLHLDKNHQGWGCVNIRGILTGRL